MALAVAASVAWMAFPASAATGAAGIPLLGATAHVGTADFNERAIAFARMREAGLRCVRFDLGWRLCQPTPDAPLDFSRYDRVFESAEAEGIEPLPILNWAPRWAVPVTEHIEEWRAYVRAAAERYRGRVAAWEVWNEPNHRAHYPHGDAKAYLEMLRAAREEIKAADPEAIVCCGGLAGADACVLKFGSDYRGAVILSGNMAVETGGVSERQQADYILRALPVAAKHNVGRFLIYALRNSEKNPHDREDHFGIVHADFSPKPAFKALKNRNR